MNKVKFFVGSNGLNTKVSPVRLKYDPETGMQELAEAVNVDVDRTGRISRRKGLRRVLEKSSPHSLWGVRSQNSCYFVAGGNLYRMGDGSIVGLKAGLTNDQAYFCEVGRDVLFNNGTDMGILRNGSTWEDWTETPYVGPENNRDYSGPPSGTFLAHYRGRIYIAQGEFLLYSEPLNHGCFDLGRNFISFQGANIVGHVAVEMGIYVATTEGVYFIKGPGPQEFEMKKVIPKPIVTGTMTAIETEFLNPEVPGLGMMTVVQDVGVVFGTGEGQVMYLTKDRVDLPLAQYGYAAANLGGDNEYLCFMEV